MTKVCCSCRRDLSVSEFYSSKKDDGYQPKCKGCHKAYRQQHYFDNRQKYIDKAKAWKDAERLWWRDYKKQFKCSICDEDHPACIQFHHDSDDKNGNVANMIGHVRRDKVLLEVAKCIPLCANCHCKLHAEEREDNR